MGFCSCTSKYILFIFNLICALVSLAVLGGSIYANVHGKTLKNFLDGQITTTTIVLICLGSAVFLIAFFGCCGAIRENHCYLITYAVILSILLLAQIAIGVLAFVSKANFKPGFTQYLQTTFDDAIKGDKNAINLMAGIQTELECCGVSTFNDYLTHHLKIPASCCKFKSKSEETCSSEDAYQEGCKTEGISAIETVLKYLGIVSMAVAGVELLGIVFAFFLASSIKRNQMRGYA